MDSEATDNAPPISGVAEIVLSVADLPKMREFYTQVLGFRLHSEVSMETADPNPEGEPTISFLTIADTETPLGHGGHPQMLVLIDYARHVFAKSRLVGHDVRRSTLNHLAFEIPPKTRDAHLKRLEDLGIDTTLAKFPHMNAQAIFFADPEGNMLELISHCEFDGTDER